MSIMENQVASLHKQGFSWWRLEAEENTNSETFSSLESKLALIHLFFAVRA